MAGPSGAVAGVRGEEAGPGPWGKPASPAAEVRQEKRAGTPVATAPEQAAAIQLSASPSPAPLKQTQALTEGLAPGRSPSSVLPAVAPGSLRGRLASSFWVLTWMLPS